MSLCARCGNPITGQGERVRIKVGESSAKIGVGNDLPSGTIEHYSDEWMHPACAAAHRKEASKAALGAFLVLLALGLAIYWLKHHTR